jgi:sugar phosphate isomerase/epimerase
MNRREFLVKSGVASAGLLASRPVEAEWFKEKRPQRIERLGIECWAIRDELRKNVEKTFAAIAAIGYREVELVWHIGELGHSPKQWRKAVEDAGLRASSAHFPPEAFDDWPRSLDKAHEQGLEYLICPDLPRETASTLDQWKRWADRFNKWGEAARKANIWLGFHNEPWMCEAIGGRIPYDVFVEATDPKLVRLQLDTGNMVAGGGDPVGYLKTYGRRYWSFHIKDYAKAPATGDVPVGTGRLDFSKFLSMVGDKKSKHFFVEWDESPAPMEWAKESFEYLQKL